MGYYGMLVATPAVAKEGSRFRPGFGWAYLQNFASPYLLVIPVLTLVFGVGGPMLRNLWTRDEHRTVSVILVVSGSGLAMAGYVVLVGGDYVHARLLMPALFAFLAPLFVVVATTRYLEGILITLAWATLCGLVLRADEQSSAFTLGHFGRSVTTDDRGFAQRGIGQPWIDGPGLYLGATFTADGFATGIELADGDQVVVATRAIGAMGYALGPDARIVDLHGLSDPLTAHQRLEFRSLPGHEKLASAPLLVAALADEPADVDSSQLFLGADLWPDPAPLEFLEQVAWARATLRCEPVARLNEASTERLTPSRFLTNLWWSVPNTILRLDRDPQALYYEHCDGGVPAEVEAFYRRATLAEQLPRDPTSDELVVIGDCEAVFARSARPGAPWQVVDGATFVATVGLDSRDHTARLAALWTLRPIGEDQAVVWMETDGSGNYRVRLDIDWFEPILQMWTPIPESGEVRVALVPNLVTQRWDLAVELSKLADLPIVFTDRSVIGATMPIEVDAGSAAGTVTVDRASPAPSDVCQSVIDHAQQT